MATTVHKNLTGSDLHEPKGADTATSGKVYVSDGAGSGVWTDASTIITNTAFTTGDLKPTHKTTADTSWILWSDGTIGDGSSNATIRANADTSALFTLYWTYYSNTLCPVYTSAGAVSTRGASAAADYAAHKRIAVPTAAGRVLGIAGTGSGLTARVVGTPVGSETTTIVTANLPSLAHSHTLNNALPARQVNQIQTVANSTGADVVRALSVQGNSTDSFDPGGTSVPMNTIPPTTFVNVMIKL